ncbi:MAG: AAA family ATPase, partial [Verrucomicrobiota bacterium]
PDGWAKFNLESELTFNDGNPVLDFHVNVVSITRHLEPSADERPQLLSEILFWPEIATFGHDEKRIRRRQVDLTELALKSGGDMSLIHERQVPGDAQKGEITLELKPPYRQTAWREPAEVRLDIVHWKHEGSTVVYIPALQIEVISQDDEKLDVVLEEHIRTAILRGGMANSLFSLAILQRTSSISLETWKLNLYPETPKERWERSISPEQARSELREVGVNLTERDLPRAWHYDEHVKTLADMLAGRRPMSVLLVGPPGVGKTAIVQQLIRERSSHRLSKFQFWKTSGAKIVAGQSGFGDWQERCHKIAEEAKDRNAILYLGNLSELLETGRAGGSSENIASFFRPRMVRGELLTILECTNEQLSTIEKRDPRVLDGLRQLKIEEPDPETAFTILQKATKDRLPYGAKASAAALRRIDSLHRRYLGYSAVPGKPIRFVERLVFDKRKDCNITVDRVNEAFSAETGLPPQLLDDKIALDPSKTTTWFKERLKGQDGAVDAVVDTIAMIKTQLGRPGKPLASFLFVGPTGVGKTELAKTLAEFFYGSKERMIRLDMSEYNSPGSATRLVSSSVGGNEGLLTAQMRDQPFSLVLLDEFEKADRQVFDLFLQVLGEARLTDGAGRVADFSNAIVIMTSNLGAASFRGGVKLGFGGEEGGDMGAEEHFVGEAKKIFRPEFFNRIDRIIPFGPLDRETLQMIVDNEIRAVHKRDGLRERQLDLELGASVITDLLKNGYDPRYGARPLRRELEQRILRRIAGELNERRNREGGVIRVTAKKVAYSKRPESEVVVEHQTHVLERTARLRRKYQRLRKASFVGELNSEIFRLNRAILQNRNGKESDPNIDGVYSRKGDIEALLERLDSQADAIIDVEEAMLLNVNDQGAAPPELVINDDYEELLVSLYATSQRPPKLVTLLFQADQSDLMIRFALDFAVTAAALDCEVEHAVFWKKPNKELMNEERTETLSEPLESVAELEELLADKPDRIGAVGLQLTGPLAWLRFRNEDGGHEFQSAGEDSKKKKKDRAVIHAVETHLGEIWMDLEELSRPDLKAIPTKRSYPARDYSREALEERLRVGLVWEAEKVL